jgi:two-component system, chemotaxis family, protein-glutamate methylesterase/glutaminase
MPTQKIRVLIVDDSAVVRKLVSDALAADPEIEVVGTAIDPYLARDKIVQLKPDVLTLDIEMPRMDGLTFLKIIMQERPLPVIIMSSLTKAGSHHAIEALRLGAVDVLGKPGGAYSFGDLGPQLIQKIKAAAVAKLRQPAPTRPPFRRTLPATPSAPAAERSTANGTNPPISASRPPMEPSTAPIARPVPRASANSTQAAPRPVLHVLPPQTRHHPRRIILLGASTGGTEALREVLSQLPGDLPGIAIVQHIPAHFSRAFADRLNACCAFEVREAVDGDRLVPGLALVAPGNYHMMIQWAGDCYRVRVADGPMVWHQRPAVDVMFKSVADIAGPNAIAGVLTGMGKDGGEGLLRLREKGAITFAQDEESSVVYGMPRVAWELGGAQRQLSLDQMADFIEHAAASAPPPAPAPKPLPSSHAGV